MDIILSNYFTTKNDPQRKKSREKDNPKLVYNWIKSLTDLDLKGIIFYDSLSDNFINKYSNNNVTFLKYNLKTNWSLNDERFLCWFNYIIKNQNSYTRIITTDLFDVSFNKNPFELIKDKNKLYVGCNSGRLIKNNSFIKKKMFKIYKKIYYNDKESVNAGVIGGYTNNISLLFKEMINDFYKYDLKMNMNMAVYNKKVYDVFSKNLEIGYPFTSKFRKNEENGSYYIKHK